MKSPLDVNCTIKPGDRFGSLEVIGQPFAIRSITSDGKPGQRRAVVVCRRDDGEVLVRRVDKLSEPTAGPRKPVQLQGGPGRTDHRRLRDAWRGMKRRCYVATSHKYARYGGRGIRVCDEWLESFAAFQQWAVASGFRQGLHLDRRDVDGDYTPENCRFVDAGVSARNSSSTLLSFTRAIGVHLLSSYGFTQPEIAGHFGVTVKCVEGALSGRAWQDAHEVFRLLKIIEELEESA